jgi:isopenicillin N synthase-like dioxygenase
MRDDHPFGILPVVDVAPLLSSRPAGLPEVAGQIEAACREHGFFYVTGHGVAPDLLARLAQDANGGLQVRTPAGWVDAPPIEGTFVANIGDMLDRLTGGWYRSTPHRVRNVSGRDRLSFPFFFDPGFTAEIPPLPGRAAVNRAAIRAGTGRTCRRSPAPTATTCWVRCPRYSRSYGGTC